MALRFGIRANDVRESIWSGDEALGPIPEQALRQWETDGDASWLEPYVMHGQPTRIQFRNLTGDELAVVKGQIFDSSETTEAMDRAAYMAFRIAVSIIGGPDRLQDVKGKWHQTSAIDHGFRMLSKVFVDQLDVDFPGIWKFYGRLVVNASLATEVEKKASSPQSTPTPSSGEASTAVTTDASQGAAVA